MMETLSFTIGVQPITKKNHQQIAINRRTGKRFVVPSQEYKNYEYDASFFMPKLESPIDEPVNVKAIFYLGSRRKTDIANLNSCLHDVLVKFGILEDDNMKIIVSTDGSRVRYDKEHPRTEVEISPVSEKDMEEVKKFMTK